MAKRDKRPKAVKDPAKAAFEAGLAMVTGHPLFAPIFDRVSVTRNISITPQAVIHDGWAQVFGNGTIIVHPKRRGSAEEWAHVLAHCALHLGLGHMEPRGNERAWSAACCCVVARFLSSIKIGRPPESMLSPPELPGASELDLYHQFDNQGIPPALQGLGTVRGQSDFVASAGNNYNSWQGPRDWTEIFAVGLRNAVDEAIEGAASSSTQSRRSGPAEDARNWFVNQYPLLGSLAASFDIITERQIMDSMRISLAAVNPELRELYIDPRKMSALEMRFIMAHELLHVGLRHDQRRQGRDAFLWNIACDYVINDWLIEMGVGEPPSVGILHDPELRGLSAEAIYDRIAVDLRRLRKLQTLRGVGMSDIIEGTPTWWGSPDGLRLDDFYRSCLAQGLDYHRQQGRGLLPAGLVEEIRALMTPPIPWDVELAHWFDERFQPLEKRRTYARPSRRQASTPNIPRARWHIREDDRHGRTFGVVLDSSGSMDRNTLARALGAIASYAAARDVSAARVVFCDAHAYDQGYMSVADIGFHPVRVRGRGGTVLQPGIDLLRNAADFPKHGPILIITDGGCDRLRVHGDHAFLLPAGGGLPFVPRGPVFRVQ